MNLQRLKAALEATGCPVAIVREVRPGAAEFEAGAGATQQQISAAQTALSQYIESGVTAGDIEYENNLLRSKAQGSLDAGLGRQLDPYELALRAFFVMIVEDRYDTVTRFNALLAEIAAATSLSDLKTRVANNVPPLQTYGATQANSVNAIKNALKQRINLGQVD